jgi:LysR family hydrogen peroxide-inducible transcriptional activator
MDITLRQMRYAIALADTGHFGRAAERSFVSQPALSQQIRQLEELCGSPLFDRSSASLTPFGRDFVARARRVVEEADSLIGFAAGHRGRPLRAIRLGIIPTVAPYLLPAMFPALTSALPDLDFAVSENRTAALLEGLASGTLDLALIASQPGPSGARLTVEPLFHDDFVLATAAGAGPAGPVPLASIDTSRMLLLDEGHCFRDQALAACGLGPDSARTFAATSLSTIVEFVANDQGVTLLPEIALRKETAGDRIAVHRLASPGAGRNLSLVWREATPFAALYRDIAALIRAAQPTT